MPAAGFGGSFFEQELELLGQSQEQKETGVMFGVLGTPIGALIPGQSPALGALVGWFVDSRAALETPPWSCEIEGRPWSLSGRAL